jgi:hypothetical protein
MSKKSKKNNNKNYHPMESSLNDFVSFSVNQLVKYSQLVKFSQLVKYSQLVKHLSYLIQFQQN